MSEILNSNNINETRFRMSKPQGYYTEDVDKFVDEVVLSSITAYELRIKEITNQQYANEQKMREMEEELSSLRLKTEFSSSASSIQSDEMLVLAIQKQESLEAQNKSLVEENQELRKTIDQWEEYSNALAQKVEEYETGNAAPSGMAAAAVNTTTTVQPAEEYNVAVDSYENPEQSAAPIYYEEPVVEDVQPVQTFIPSVTPVMEPAQDSAPTVTSQPLSFSDSILSNDLEISEDELAKALAEAGDFDEDDAYMASENIKPEDL
jgi:hypothetical protein